MDTNKTIEKENLPDTAAGKVDNIITPGQVEHIANLCRVELRPGDREKFAGQLGHIIEYVNKLQNIDTEGVEPAAFATSAVNVMRPDEQKPSLTTEEILQNAPNKENNLFKMPRILNLEDAS